MNIFLNILIIIVTAFVFTLVNLKGSIDGGITAFNLLLSIIYITVIFALGVFNGVKNKKNILIIATIFWILGLIITLLYVYTNEPFLLILSFLFISPLNGFKIIFSELSSVSYLLLITIVPMILSHMGYVIGYLKSKKV